MPTPISVYGSLDFGGVVVGSNQKRTFTIQNTGNSPMTVSSITYPDGFTGDWNSGTVAAGASQTVNVTFAPTQSQSYSGTVTVNSDKTGGVNTITASGRGFGKLKKAGDGNGELKSEAFGNSIILSASPYTGSKFDGWSPSSCGSPAGVPESVSTCTGKFTKMLNTSIITPETFGSSIDMSNVSKNVIMDTNIVSIEMSAASAKMNFAKAVNSVSLTLADYSGNTVVKAYNIMGNVLKTIPIINPAAQIYTISNMGAARDNAGDIAKVEIISSDADFVELGFTGNVVRGDINFDGEGDLKDTILMLQVLAGVDAPATLYPQFSLNGKQITLEDVVFNLQRVAGLR